MMLVGTLCMVLGMFTYATDRIASNHNEKVNFGYFLRTRSKVDLDGNVVQANYVKIAGDFNFDPRSEGKGAAYLEMTYYLNPTLNDRNVEFDPRQNLLKNLKRLEKVGAP